MELSLETIDNKIGNIETKDKEEKDTDYLVKLNLSGETFETYKSTLISNSIFFRSLLTSDIDHKDPIFINRDSVKFKKLMNYVRDNKLVELRDLLESKENSVKDLFDEIKYYGIELPEKEKKEPINLADFETDGNWTSAYGLSASLPEDNKYGPFLSVPFHEIFKPRSRYDDYASFEMKRDRVFLNSISLIIKKKDEIKINIPFKSIKFSSTTKEFGSEYDVLEELNWDMVKHFSRCCKKENLIQIPFFFSRNSLNRNLVTNIHKYKKVPEDKFNLRKDLIYRIEVCGISKDIEEVKLYVKMEHLKKDHPSTVYTNKNKTHFLAWKLANRVMMPKDYSSTKLPNYGDFSALILYPRKSIVPVDKYEEITDDKKYENMVGEKSDINKIDIYDHMFHIYGMGGNLLKELTGIKDFYLINFSVIYKAEIWTGSAQICLRHKENIGCDVYVQRVIEV